MKIIKHLLEDIIESEKKVFVNGEHYNEIGRQTRKKILEIAGEIDNGFFVEVGACMGTDTKLLEFAGWNGLLIEPSEGLYGFCKNTRNCIVENYALVSNEYTKETISNIPVFSLPDNINSSANSNLYKTITFDSLAEKHNIKKIDIFVLDVEGLEIDILNGINFDKTDITNFIIECNEQKYSLDFLNELMNSKGYKNMGLAEHLGAPDSGLADYHYKKI
jgi:FkbM family methyltransferase